MMAGIPGSLLASKAICILYPELQQKKEHDKNTHLCFSVASVPEFVKVLAKNKVEYENWAGEKMAITTRVDGVKQIYFKDPDGYWIEINDAKE